MGVPRFRVTADPVGPSLTKQAMALETDINAIVARHIAHGVGFPAGGPANYGDFSDSLSYHDALNSLREAEQSFGMLPAAVRDFCDNDPGKFLDLVFDPAKRADLEKLGLVPAAVPVPPVVAPSPAPGVVPAPSPTP